MSWDKIVAGDFGQTGQLTVLDVDTEAAADVSAYSTSQEMIFRDPDGNEETKTAAFATDGSDGVVEYTLADGDVPEDQPGHWDVRVVVTSGSAQLTSTWLPFTVLE